MGLLKTVFFLIICIAMLGCESNTGGYCPGNPTNYQSSADPQHVRHNFTTKMILQNKYDSDSYVVINMHKGISADSIKARMKRSLTIRNDFYLNSCADQTSSYSFEELPRKRALINTPVKKTLPNDEDW